MTALRRLGNVTIRFWILTLALLAAGAVFSATYVAANSPPTTPASVSLTRADGTLTASGYAVSDATKYHVTYSDDGGGSWSLASDNHAGTSITINGVDDAKAYIVGVRAGNASGWSGWRNSPSINAIGQSSPPSTPSTVTVTREDGTLIASGYSVSGATKYHVTYRANGEGNWRLASNNHTGTSITITGVNNAKTYVVGVRAGNASGWSGWRNSASIQPAPAAPSVVNVKRGHRELVVSGYAVPGATKYYIIYKASDGDWLPAALDTANTTTTINRSVHKDKTYIVAVRAGNGNGWSGWRISKSIPPLPSTPSTPSAVTVTRAAGTLTASTPVVAGVTKYHVTYSSDGGGSWSLAAYNHTSASITISGVDDTKTYIVGMRAGNEGGWSRWRNSPPAANIAVSVDNLGETRSAFGSIGRFGATVNRRAAGFTTGSNSSGYKLQSVTLKMGSIVGSPTGLTAAIHAESASSQGNPAASATYTLTGPTSPVANAENTYSCAGACSLNKDTEYFLVLSPTFPSTGTHYYRAELTRSDNQTNTPADAGWSLADVIKESINGGNWTDSSFSDALKFKVTATPK